MPTNGVIALRLYMYDMNDSDLHVTVTDPSGADVLGALETIHSQPGTALPGGPSPWRLVVWRPNSSLEPSSTYALELACGTSQGYGSTVEESLEFTTGSGPAGPPVIAEVVESKALETYVGGGEKLCCELDSCREDTCTGDLSCTECWDELRIPLPQVSLRLHAGAGGLPAHQTVAVVSTPAGDSPPMFLGDTTIPAYFWENLDTDADGPWCVTVRTQSLADSTWSEAQQVCMGESMVLSDISEASTPGECKEVAGGDVSESAGDSSDSGGADTNEEESDPGEGCNAANRLPPSGAWFAFLLLGLAIRRS